MNFKKIIIMSFLFIAVYLILFGIMNFVLYRFVDLIGLVF